MPVESVFAHLSHTGFLHSWQVWLSVAGCLQNLHDSLAISGVIFDLTLCFLSDISSDLWLEFSSKVLPVRLFYFRLFSGVFVIECKTVCLKAYAQILLFLILHRFS